MSWQIFQSKNHKTKQELTPERQQDWKKKCTITNTTCKETFLPVSVRRPGCVCCLLWSGVNTSLTPSLKWPEVRGQLTELTAMSSGSTCGETQLARGTDVTIRCHVHITRCDTHRGRPGTRDTQRWLFQSLRTFYAPLASQSGRQSGFLFFCLPHLKAPRVMQNSLISV